MHRQIFHHNRNGCDTRAFDVFRERKYPMNASQPGIFMQEMQDKSPYKKPKHVKQALYTERKRGLHLAETMHNTATHHTWSNRPRDNDPRKFRGNKWNDRACSTAMPRVPINIAPARTDPQLCYY